MIDQDATATDCAPMSLAAEDVRGILDAVIDSLLA